MRFSHVITVLLTVDGQSKILPVSRLLPPHKDTGVDLLMGRCTPQGNCPQSFVNEVKLC